MEIKGKVHCFFEQSGVFKNEFKKLGYEAFDYDIQDNFGETDYVKDLFAEIENAYSGCESIFDNITKDDLIMAFFPCIYFTGSTNPCYYTLENINYQKMTTAQKIDAMLKRSKSRQYFYELIIKLVGVCLDRGVMIIIENPYSPLHYLCNNFFKAPDVFDKDRQRRGDYFRKPTGYWFFNCVPTNGYSYQKPKEKNLYLVVEVQIMLEDEKLYLLLYTWKKTKKLSINIILVWKFIRYTKRIAWKHSQR